MYVCACIYTWASETGWETPYAWFLSTLLSLQSELLHLPTMPRLPSFPLCARCSWEPAQGALIQRGFLVLPDLRSWPSRQSRSLCCALPWVPCSGAPGLFIPRHECRAETNTDNFPMLPRLAPRECHGRPSSDIQTAPHATSGAQISFLALN